GVMQWVSRSAQFYLYDTQHFGLPLGFFSNRNHQAALLYTGALMVLMVSKAPIWRGFAPHYLSFGLVLIFGACIISTESRAGLALYILTMLCALPLVANGLGWR